MKFFAKNIFIVLALVSGFALVASTAAEAFSAGFNPEINYQGRLVGISNVAVTDGLYNMRFSLYTAATGGVPIWQEVDSTTNRIQVTSGLFSVMLGSTTPLTNIDFNQTLYLGVEIGGTDAVTPAWDGEMVPRKVIGAVPAAFVANNVIGDIASTTYATSTNATSTNFFAQNAVFTNLFATNQSFTNAIVTNSTTTNATSTNFFTNILNAVTASTTNFFASGSSTLQNFTFVNATGTSATTTNLFSTNATFTNLFTNALSLANLLVTSSSTLQNFTAVNSTTTNATTTSLFANVLNAVTASTTNLFVSSSSTLQNFTFVNATGTSATTTNFFSTNLFTTNLNTSGLGTFNNLLVLGSSTLQNFTALNSTTTNATSSTLYVSGNTILAATSGNVGIGTSNPTETLVVKATAASSASLFQAGTSGVPSDVYSFGFVSNPTSGDVFSIRNSNSLASSMTGSLLNLDTAVVASTTYNLINAKANGVTQFLVRGDGSVGIGTSTPTATLSLFETPANLNTNGFAFSIGSSTAAFATTTLFSVDTQGNVSILGSALHLGSTTLQNFTFVNATGTSATTTNLFATTLVATTATITNALHLGSTTLQNFTFVNATGTSATTTNFFSTNISATTATFTNTLHLGSTTLQNFTGINSTTTNSTSTNFFATNLFGTTGNLTNLLLNGSSTLQNFTFVNATGSQATTTNFFSTNLFATNFNTSSLGTFGNLLVLGSSTLQNFTALNSTTTNATSSTLYVSGNTILAATSGTVGIGTTTPTFALDISNTSGNLLRVTNTNSGTNISLLANAASQAAINFGNAATQGSLGKIAYDNSNNSMLFNTNGNTRLTILSTGAIGIGTTTPTAALSIFQIPSNRNTNNLAFSIGSSTAAFATTTLFAVDDQGNVTVAGSTTLQNFTFVNATGTSATTTNFFSTNGTFTNLFGTTINFTNLLVTGSSTLQNFTFLNATGTSATTTNLYTSGQTILAGVGGNVGIGTTTPATTLDINGTAQIEGSGNLLSLDPYGAPADQAYITANNRTYLGFDGNNAVIQGTVGKGIVFNVNNSTFGSGHAAIITSAGAVGIGTTTPGDLLQVSAFNGVALRLQDSNTSTGGDVRISQVGNNTNFFEYSASHSLLSNPLTFTGVKGFVGVSNNAPTLLLHVGTSSVVNIPNTNYYNSEEVSGDLEVKGTLYAGTTTGTIIVPAGFTTGSALFIGPTGAITQNNSQFFWDNTGDRLGLGTAIPNTQLELKSATPTIRLNASSNHQWDLSSLITGNAFAIQDNTTGVNTQPFTIEGSAPTNSLYVRSNGNVGINTSSANFNLEVNGTASTTNLYATFGTTTNATSTNLFATNANFTNLTAGTISFTNLLVLGSTTLQNFTFVNATGTNATTTNLKVSGNLNTSLTQNSIPFIGSGGLLTENNANFNFNNSTSLLTLVGNASTTELGSTGSSYFATSNGNVGIGTTAPQGGLEIDKATTGTLVGNGNILRVNSSNAVNARSEIGFGNFLTTGANSPVIIGFQQTSNTGFTNGPFYIATRNVTTDTAPTIRLTVDVNGNVGLGTSATNPNFTLEVGGAASTTALFAGNATTTGALNVGTNLVATGALSTFSNSLFTGSSTLQNFTFVNATGSQATTTNFFSTTGTFTNLFATTATFTNTLHLGSTTLQNFTALNSTTTNATSSTLYVAGNTVLAATSGNVGIGTTLPSSLLQVGQFNTAANTFVTIDAAAASQAGFNIRSAGSNVAQIYRPANSTDLRIFGQTLGTDIATFNTVNGSVGIGTTTPTGLLSLFATPANLNSNQAVFTVGSSTAAFATSTLFTILNGGNVGIGTAAPDYEFTVAGTGANMVDFYRNGSQLGSLSASNNDFGVYALQNGSGTGILRLGSGGTTQETILVNGNVGIGTTTPASTFSVFATPANLNSNQSIFSIGSSTAAFATTTLVNVLNNGNVGIGNAAPTKLVEIGTSANETTQSVFIHGQLAIQTNRANLSQLQLQDSAGGDTYTVGAGITNIANAFGIRDSTASGAPVRFLIDGSGNTGIGTSTPFAKLSVFDTPSNLNTTAFAIGSSTAAFATTTLFSVDNQGNVTILGSSLHLGSTTLQNFTGVNSTTTNATTTNLAISGSLSTSLTQGSVPFIGAGGLLTQNNAQLFWDNTNNRLGIGSSTPNYKLSVAGTAAFGQSAGEQIFIRGTTNQSISFNRDPNTGNMTDPNSYGYNLVHTPSSVAGTDVLNLTVYNPSGSSIGNLLSINSNGEVGVGSSTPNTKLVVFDANSGNSIFAYGGGSTYGGGIIQNDVQVVGQQWLTAVGGGDNSFVKGNGWFLRDITAGATRLAVDTSGNLGVGTSSPNAAVDVYNSNDSTLRLNRTNSSVEYLQLAAARNGSTGQNNQYLFDVVGNSFATTRQLNFRFSTTSGAFFDTALTFNPLQNITFNYPIVVSTTTATSTFSTGGLAVGTNQFVVQQSSGNIGIGTSSPYVNFALALSGNVNTLLQSTGGGTSALQIKSGGDSQIILNRGSSGQQNLITFQDAGTNKWAIGNLTGGGGTNSDFKIFDYGSAEVLDIKTGTGNTGIGTTSPQSKLAVSGGASIGADYNFAAPANSLIVESKVGIGTSSPTNLLDLAAGNNGATGLIVHGTTVNATLSSSRLTLTSDYGTTDGGYIENSAGNLNLNASNGTLGVGAVTFLTGGVERARLNSNGFGFGTTSPTGLISIFDTPSNLNTTAFIIGSSTAAFATSTLVTVLNNGNVGIGTAAPTGILNVAGIGNATDFEISRTVGSNVFAINAPGGANTNTAFWINNNQVLGLQSNGGVGIGTTFGNGNTTDPANGLVVQGNTGIGTTTPTATLSVFETPSNLNANGLAFSIGSSTAAFATTTLFSVDNQGNVTITGSTTLQNFTFINATGTNATTSTLYVSGNTILAATTGSVGVGTTTPTAKLQVYPNANSTIGLIVQGDNNASSNIQQWQTSAGVIQLAIDNQGNIIKPSAAAADLKISQGNSGNSIIFLAPTETFRSNSTYAIDARSSALPIRLANTASLVGRNAANGADITIANVDSSNNVRVGPSGELTVVGGSVGIATTTPGTSSNADKLDVVGNIGLSGTIGSGLGFAGGAGAASFATIQPYVAATGHTVINNQNFTIDLQTAGVNRLNILNNGNAGFGTTTPTATVSIFETPTNLNSNGFAFTIGSSTAAFATTTLFSVNNQGNVTITGSTTLQNFTFINATGTNATTSTLYVSGQTILAATSGRLGVGTTSPQSELAVSGNASIGADYNVGAPANGLIVEGSSGFGESSIGSSAQLAVVSSNNDSNVATPIADFNGGFIRIGDPQVAATLTNGTGIKFEDQGTAHASLKYLASSDRMDFCGSSSNSTLTCSGTPTLTLLTLNNSNGGNVGIGNSAPNFKLDVTGDINATGLYHVQNNQAAFDTTDTHSVIYGTGNSGSVYPFLTAGNLVLQSRPSGANRDIVFVTGSTPAVSMVVQGGTGSVGVGTTSPTATFSVFATPANLNSNLSIFSIGSSTAAFATTTLFNISNTGLATLTNLLVSGSSTLQNFTGINATTTNATSSTLYVSGNSFLAATGGSATVGTTNPSGFNFGVVGTSAFGGNVSLMSCSALTCGNKGTFSYVDATGNATYASSGGTQQHFIFNITGNLGVGTTSPLSKVSIVTASGGKLPTSGVNPSNSILSLKSSSNNALYMGMDTASPFEAWIQAADVTGLGSTYPIVLNPTGGNVGIGSSTPEGRLTVLDTVAASSNSHILDLQTGYTSNSAQKGIDWWDGSNITGQIDTRYDGSQVSMGFGHLFNGGYQTGDVMVIRGNGNVGIGTSTPQSNLSVVGNVLVSQTSGAGTPGSAELITNAGSPVSARLQYGTDGTGWQFRIAKNTAGVISDQLTINDSGNVSIGTTGAFNGTTRLTVSGGNEVITQAGGTSSSLDFDQNGVVGWTLKNNATTGLFTVDNGAATALSITNGGSNPLVGIGITSSSAKLEVNGTLQVDASTTLQNFTGSNSTTTNSTTTNFYISSSGGVGTTTAVATLAVQAAVRQTPFVVASSTGAPLLSIDTTGALSAKLKQLTADYTVDGNSGSISVGDIVSYINGNAEKGQVSLTGASTTANALNTVWISAAALDTTHFVLAYQPVGTTFATAIVGTISSGTTITFGSAVALNAVNSTFVSVAALDSTHFVTSYANNTSTFVEAVVSSVSGTTITPGTPVALNGVNSTTNTYTGTAALDSTHFVTVYRGNSVAAAVVSSVSGTTITAGTPVTIVGSNPQYTTVTTMDSTHFVMGYEDNNVAHTNAVAASVSGTTITFGSVIQVDSINDILGYDSISALDSTHFVLAASDASAGGVVATVGTISGTTITSGTTVSVGTADTDQYVSVAALDPSHFVVTFEDTNVTQMFQNTGSVAGTTITAGSQVTLITTGPAGTKGGLYTAVASLGSVFVVGYQSNITGTPAKAIAVQPQSNRYLGMATTAASAGGTVTVASTGIVNGLSGLAAGGTYYYSPSTGLTQSPQTYKVGLALTTSSILLDSGSGAGSDQFFGDAVFANAFRIAEAPGAPQGLVFKNQLGRQIMNIDEDGNLTIAGTITTSNIASTTDFTQIFASTTQMFASTTQMFASTTEVLASTTDTLASTTAVLASVAQELASVESAIGFNIASSSAGLDIGTNVTIRGALRVDQVGAIGDVLALESDVNFLGRPYFNSDTGGLAVVKQGDMQVDVAFDKPYVNTPIVNASLSLDASSSDAQVQNILGAGANFAVVHRSQTGFTILLSKPAVENMTFSWIALAIQNMRITSSAGASQSTVTTVSSSTPTTPIASSTPDTSTSTPVVTGDTSTSTPATSTPSTIDNASSTPDTTASSTQVTDTSTTTQTTIDNTSASSTPDTIDISASTTSPTTP